MTDTITDTDTIQTAPATENQPASVVSQFARQAASGPLSRVSEVLGATADTLDKLLGGVSSPLPDTAKGIVTSASAKLRSLGDRATEEEAAKLIASLQTVAADHPAATAGISAAVGAALGLALTKLGEREIKSSSKPKKAD